MRSITRLYIGGFVDFSGVTIATTHFGICFHWSFANAFEELYILAITSFPAYNDVFVTFL